MWPAKLAQYAKREEGEIIMKQCRQFSKNMESRCSNLGQYRKGADVILCDPCLKKVRKYLSELWSCTEEEVME